MVISPFALPKFHLGEGEKIFLFFLAANLPSEKKWQSSFHTINVHLQITLQNIYRVFTHYFHVYIGVENINIVYMDVCRRATEDRKKEKTQEPLKGT